MADRWYHGTRRGFTPGGVLLPRAQTGAAPTTAPLNPGHTLPTEAVGYCYVTRDFDVAHAYALAAAGRGAPKVLEVQPWGEVTRDPEHSWATDAWRCAWATVLRVHRLGV